MKPGARMYHNPLTGEPLLEHQEVAKLLGVHRNTIHNWIQNGIIPYIRIGKRKTRIPKWQLQEWINKTFGGKNMAKMTDEEVRKFYETPSPEDYEPGDIETLKGGMLLEEMNVRALRALARCGSILDEFYPCFEKAITVKLRDTKDRVPDQIIGCDVEAYLTKDKKHTVPEQKRVARELRNMKRGGDKPANDKEKL